MPVIVSAATAFPPHRFFQDEIRDVIAGIFAGRIEDLEKILAVFDNAKVGQRQFVRPLEWYLRPSSMSERNLVYRREGLELTAAAAGDALLRAGVKPERVDQVIFVSSTGISAPTLDSYLINRIGMRPETKRLPLWGLGCAAGAAGLARAFDCCLGAPRNIVLVVALECCSLTFEPSDATKKNVVATSIFADGAGAAVVAGDQSRFSGPQILASRSHLFPDTYRIMGWDVLDAGLELVLSPRLPAVVKQEIPRLVKNLQEDHDLDDFSFYLTHPGGAKVIDAYREALELEESALSLTEEVLRDHGNISSVSVLAVLEQWLAGKGEHGGTGLLSAFGPGFSAELLAIRET